MQRDSFVFYRSFAEGLNELDGETRLACYDALLAYALDGVEPSLTGVAKAMFTLIKPQIDANNKRFENGMKGAAYGKLGGRPKKNPIGVIEENPIGVSNKNPEKTPNVNVNENVNGNVNDIGEKETPKKRFVPPTIEEVREYCRERGNRVSPERFVAFYSAKNWFIGKNKMKDWKQAIITWELNDKKEDKSRFGNMQQNHYTADEMSELERKLLEN